MESVAELGWTVAREVMVITERVVKVLTQPVRNAWRVWYGRV
jgi:hypothetical protein